MGRREILVAILSIASILCFAGSSSAFSRTDTLRGIEGIEILIEEFKPEVEDFISVLQAQTDLEGKLRQAGIRILTKEENEKLQPQRKPYLYVKITAYKPPARRDVLAFNAEMSLKQQVRLNSCRENPDAVFYSPTWYKNSVSVVTLRNAGEIKNVLDDLTEKFIKAYITAKAKK